MNQIHKKLKLVIKEPEIMAILELLEKVMIKCDDSFALFSAVGDQTFLDTLKRLHSQGYCSEKISQLIELWAT